MENWIIVKTLKGDRVRVRQGERFSKMFIGEDGTMYDASDLDFTASHFDDDILKIFHESNMRYDERQVEYKELTNKILSSLDANTIADHKAKIDEREYWRKLRGETFASLRKEYRSDLEALNQTEFIIGHLYQQDQEFFKDK